MTAQVHLPASLSVARSATTDVVCAVSVLESLGLSSSALSFSFHCTLAALDQGVTRQLAEKSFSNTATAGEMVTVEDVGETF